MFNLKSLIYQYRWLMILAIVLSILNGVASILILNYINHDLVSITQVTWSRVEYFIAIVIGFFLISLSANVTLQYVGQLMVHKIRLQMVKSILDTDYQSLEAIGKDKIYSSMSSDLSQASWAMVQAAIIVQTTIFGMFVLGYLIYLSWVMFLVVIGLIVVLLGLIVLPLNRAYANATTLRDIQDEVYLSLSDVINGHRELKLNTISAEKHYNEQITPTSLKYLYAWLKTTFYFELSSAIPDMLILLIVGAIYLINSAFNLTTTAQATTFVIAILFFRSNFVNAIGSYPEILKAKVIFKKLASFNLAHYQPEFKHVQLASQWSTLRLENISYSYINDQGEETFGIKNINLTIKRGEITFLIGKNGSGKSTLAMILTGLYKPTGGKIYLDDIEITPELYQAYCQQLSAVFSDFYLFAKLITPADKELDPNLLDKWLNKLEIYNKVDIIEQKLSTTKLSTGQRKRLALLVALVEKRPLLVLDEWAADQDPNFRRTFYQEILPELIKEGHSIFAISHDEAYFDVADRILLIKDGKISELDTTGIRNINISKTV